MPKASPGLGNFNAGELSPRLEARVDIGKYANGCKTLENFIPMIQGPAVRRGGTRFVSETLFSSLRSWLIPFQPSVTEAYQIEFTDGFLQFYINHGVLLYSGIAPAWNIATVYGGNEYVQYLGVTYMSIEALNVGNQPNLSPAQWIVADRYRITSPYSAGLLTDGDGNLRLQYVPSNDVMYLAHPNYPPYKLSRFSSNDWRLELVDYKDGPFDPQNSTATTLYSSAATGAVTVTASAATFVATDVGRLLRLSQKSVVDVRQWEPGKAVVINDVRRSDGKNYIALNAATTGTIRPIHVEGAVFDGDTGVQWQFLDAGYGYLKITGFTSSTVVTGTVIKRLPTNAVGAPNATTRWQLGSWGAGPGYPSHVTFFKERLVWARDLSLWMSVTGDYEVYSDRDDGGVVADDSAVSITIQSDQQNNIQWLKPYDSLLVGTTGGEAAVQPITVNQVFGPANVTAPVVSSFGSRQVQPLRVSDSILFVQRSGIKLREIIYNSLATKFESKDLTVLSEHITQGGLGQIAYQQEPYSIAWGVRADGQLLGFTYNKEQEVEGWHRHPLGGSGIVECVSCIPAPDGTRDEVWMIVRRTVDGATVRYVEYMEKEYQPGDTQASSFYVDSGLTYDGAPASVITGLDHLEGETVSVLVDGATHPDREVVGGSITLQAAASVVHVGYRAPARLQTERLEAGAGDGTAQGKVARINRATIRLLNTLGLKFGQSFDALDTVDFRYADDFMDVAPPLFSGDLLLDFPGDYTFDNWLCFEQDDPLPVTIVGIFPQTTVQDR